MPHTFNYAQVLSLITQPRLGSYQQTFAPNNECELYGIYIWAQHVVGAIYPLTQTVEISLRNAIDSAARSKLGDCWWRLPQFNTPAFRSFTYCFDKAETSLTRAWRARERERLGLPAAAALPSAPPTWMHDKIVAATDFSTWEFALKDDFASQTQAQNSLFLWPQCMSRAFRKYHQLSPSSTSARHAILNLVREIREYRNRLFHHDKIWTGGPGVSGAAAIASIRNKINKMEQLLGVINPKLPAIMEKVGVLHAARRVCSEQELAIYRYAHVEPGLTPEARQTLGDLADISNATNATVAWSDASTLYGLHKIR